VQEFGGVICCDGERGGRNGQSSRLVRDRVVRGGRRARTRDRVAADWAGGRARGAARGIRADGGQRVAKTPADREINNIAAAIPPRFCYKS